MQAKDLIVLGSSRLLGKLYCGDIDIGGTASFGGKITTNQLVVSSSTDISGTSTPGTAPLVIGNISGVHIEIDPDEIIAKNNTSTSHLYLNYNGGNVYLSGNTVYASGSTMYGTTFSGTTGNITNITSTGTSTFGTTTITNATVNSTLKANKIEAVNVDVADELRAAKYSIETVQNLGGHFLVCPTLEFPSNATNFSITVTKVSSTEITIAITDNQLVNQTFVDVTWNQYSKVKFVGTVNNIGIPTCSGHIQSFNTGSKTMTLRMTVTSDIADKFATAFTGNSTKVENISVMMYQLCPNTSQSTTLYPIGIYLTAYGSNRYSYIDVYGGTSSTAVVRMGKLNGLPYVNNEAPTGWGFYAKGNAYLDGIIVSTSGNIAGWNLDNNSFHKLNNGNWGVDGSALICTGSSTQKSIGGSPSNTSGWVLTAGSHFGVTDSGSLYCNSVNVTGVVNATTGTFGNATTKISLGTGTSGNSAMYYGMSTLSSTANGFYVGTDGIALGGGKFKVTSNGALNSTSGYIANWKIEGNDLVTGTWGENNSAMLCTGSTSQKSIGGSPLINGWVFTAGDKFGVTQTGDVYASSIHLNGVGSMGVNLHKDAASLSNSTWVYENATVDGGGVATINISGSGNHRIYQLPSNGYWTNWAANTTYTVSIEAKGSTTGCVLSIEPYATNVGAKQYTLTTDWQRYSYTFTSGSSTSTSSCSYILGSAPSNASIQVRKPKLEIGNISTEYSVSPQEISNGLIVHTVNLSTSTYNQDTWYPCLVYFYPTAPQGQPIVVECSIISGGGTPNWSTHDTKHWGCSVSATYYYSQWGWRSASQSYIEAYDFTQIGNVKPITFSDELNHGQYLVMYLRGGAIYPIATNADYLDVYTSSITLSSQTVSPTTTQPVNSSTFVVSRRQTETNVANAAKVATDYMYFTGSTGLNIASSSPSSSAQRVNIKSDTGIKIYHDNNNHADITSGGLNVVQGGNTVASFGSSIAIGQSSGTNGNVYIDSSGIQLRRGTSSYVTLANDSTNGYFVRIGMGTSGHVMIKNDGLQIWCGSSGSTLTANLGYGPGKDVFGDQTNAPFYTFGKRHSDTVGNWSVAEGYETISSDFASYSEGHYTISSGLASHAEGDTTHASGMASHSQNQGTIAQGYCQTAIGNYNIAQGDSDSRSKTDWAFIIGNGTSENYRSNALTVNWNGDVNARAFYDGTVSNNSLTLALGTYISAGLLTNAGRELVFSIPTGRVFPNGTTVYSISFDIVVRIASTDPSASSGSGAYYIVKKTSGGTDTTSFNSTINSSFYDGNNTSRTLASGNWTKTLQGGTNILIDLYNSTSNFFTGNATVLNRVNNMPCAVYLLNISVVLNLPTT